MGTSTSNVKCSECAPGSFQSGLSSTARCLEHTVCPNAVLIPGNSTHDNICGLNIQTNTTRTPNYETLRPLTTGITPPSIFDDDTSISTRPPTISDASQGRTINKPVSFTGAEVFGTNNVYNNSLLWVMVCISLAIGISLFTANVVYYYCYFKAAAGQQTQVFTSSTIRPVIERRYKLKAGVDIRDVYWFLAKKIPHQIKARFYHCLHLEQCFINDVIYANDEGVTTEKYKILLKWQETQGKSATLDALIDVMDLLHLRQVKEQLVTEFCQVSPENSTWV